jgi:hypothetical protein
MYTVFLCALIAAVWYLHLPVWVLLPVIVAKAVIMLAPHTWEDFLAAMNVARVQGGGRVMVNPDPDQRGNEPDAAWIVRYLLLPPALVRNWLLMNVAAVFYFRTWPRWGKESGLTNLLNRLIAEDTGWRRAKALAVRQRWLNRYDPRGVHT